MEKFILFDSDGYVQPEYFHSISAAVSKCEECFSKSAYNSVSTFVAVRIKDSEPVKCFTYTRYQFFHGFTPNSYEL